MLRRCRTKASIRDRLKIAKLHSSRYDEESKKCLISLSSGRVVWIRCMSYGDYVRIIDNIHCNSYYEWIYSTVTSRLLRWKILI